MPGPYPRWQLFGTFWPLIGFGLVILVTLLTSGAWRWWMLYAGPLLVITPCLLYAEAIAYDGNMLFAVIFMLSVVGLIVYYPILIFVSAVIYLRHNRNVPK